MNRLQKPLSNRYLATLLTAALAVSIGLTLVSFDQLGGFALFTGHAVTDQSDMPEDGEGIDAISVDDTGPLPGSLQEGESATGEENPNRNE